MWHGNLLSLVYRAESIPQTNCHLLDIHLCDTEIVTCFQASKLKAMWQDSVFLLHLLADILEESSKTFTRGSPVFLSVDLEGLQISENAGKNDGFD